jgi:hypothetical protein
MKVKSEIPRRYAEKNDPLTRLSGFICVTTINLIKSDKKQCYIN